MVQSVLIFALGFFAALLLSLAVAPTIWRRAVYLTRKRIEAALPLTANELNAEKDVQRAEHALEVRRMERRIKDLREQGTEQKIAYETLAAKVAGYEARAEAATARAGELEAELAKVTGRLHQQTAELSETSILLESVSTELEVRTDELRAANRKAEESSPQTRSGQKDDASRRIDRYLGDIATRDARIAKLNATIQEMRQERNDLKREISGLNAEGNASGSLLSMERRRLGQLEAKLDQAVAHAQSLEEKLAAREKELYRARGKRGAGDDELKKMEARALAAEEVRKAQEQEIAEMTDRLNRLGNASFDDTERGQLVEELQVRLAQQAVAIAGLEMERDTLQRELSVARTGDPASADDALREKLNQLAAEVVAMAAKLEGPQSRINTILDDTVESRAGDVISLAERIKELQRGADGQRSRA